MPEIRIVAAVHWTKGTNIEFDNHIKRYFEFIPGAHILQKAQSKLYFPFQYDLDEIIDQIVNQSIKKVKNLDILTDAIIVQRGLFFERLHKPRKRVKKEFTRFPVIEIALKKEYVRRGANASKK